MRTLAFLVAFAFALPATATTVRLHADESLLATAAVAALGVVQDVTVRAHPYGWIVTDITMLVQKPYKGARAGEVLTWRQPGGTLGGRTMKVAGTSRYAVGEQVLVFLERNAEGLVELGVGAGKFKVELRDGVPWAQRQVGALQWVSVNGTQAQVAQPPSTLPLPLAELERKLGWVQP